MSVRASWCGDTSCRVLLTYSLLRIVVIVRMVSMHFVEWRLCLMCLCVRCYALRYHYEDESVTFKAVEKWDQEWYQEYLHLSPE